MVANPVRLVGSSRLHYADYPVTHWAPQLGTTMAETTKKTTKKATKKAAATTRAAAKKANARGPKKTTAAKKASTKSAAKKSAAKKSTAKKRASKKTVAKPTAAKKAASKKPVAKKAPAKKKSPFGKRFLDAQRNVLTVEREKYVISADTLRAEADALLESREPGDVQFDEESGEGDTLAVERERDLALSAHARAAVEQIDAALLRIDNGVYGVCLVSGDPIPKERLEAIPWAAERVEHKAGGLGRR